MVSSTRENYSLYIHLIIDALRQGFVVDRIYIDIACRLLLHIRKQYGGSQLLTDLGLIVPVWHANMHVESCRDLQSFVRHELRAGLHDGEGQERDWAVLSQSAGGIRSTTHRHYVGDVERVMTRFHEQHGVNLPRLSVERTVSVEAKLLELTIRLQVLRSIIPAQRLTDEEGLFALFLSHGLQREPLVAGADSVALRRLAAQEAIVTMLLELRSIRAADTDLLRLRPDGDALIASNQRRVQRLVTRITKIQEEMGWSTGDDAWAADTDLFEGGFALSVYSATAKAAAKVMKVLSIAEESDVRRSNKSGTFSRVMVVCSSCVY